jgi:hypothetical protein
MPCRRLGDHRLRHCRCARHLISEARTANPLRCSPAHIASTAVLGARMFVWNDALVELEGRNGPIRNGGFMER